MQCCAAFNMSPNGHKHISNLLITFEPKQKENKNLSNNKMRKKLFFFLE